MVLMVQGSLTPRFLPGVSQGCCIGTEGKFW